MSGTETYLGDGLYASFDGLHVKLRAAGRERVGVFDALLDYAKAIDRGFGDRIDRIDRAEL